MKHADPVLRKHQSHEEATSRRIVSMTSAAVVLFTGLLLGYAAFYWFSLNPSSAVIVNGTAANRAVSYRYPWPGHTVFFAPARWVDRHVRPTYWEWRVEHELRIDLHDWLDTCNPPNGVEQPKCQELCLTVREPPHQPIAGTQRVAALGERKLPSAQRERGSAGARDCRVVAYVWRKYSEQIGPSSENQ